MSLVTQLFSAPLVSGTIVTLEDELPEPDMFEVGGLVLETELKLWQSTVFACGYKDGNTVTDPWSATTDWHERVTRNYEEDPDCPTTPSGETAEVLTRTWTGDGSGGTCVETRDPDPIDLECMDFVDLTYSLNLSASDLGGRAATDALLQTPSWVSGLSGVSYSVNAVSGTASYSKAEHRFRLTTGSGSGAEYAQSGTLYIGILTRDLRDDSVISFTTESISLSIGLGDTEGSWVTGANITPALYESISLTGPPLPSGYKAYHWGPFSDSRFVSSSRGAVEAKGFQSFRGDSFYKKATVSGSRTVCTSESIPALSLSGAVEFGLSGATVTKTDTLSSDVREDWDDEGIDFLVDRPPHLPSIMEVATIENNGYHGGKSPGSDGPGTYGWAVHEAIDGNRGKAYPGDQGAPIGATFSVSALIPEIERSDTVLERSGYYACGSGSRAYNCRAVLSDEWTNSEIQDAATAEYTGGGGGSLPQWDLWYDSNDAGMWGGLKALNSNVLCVRTGLDGRAFAISNMVVATPGDTLSVDANYYKGVPVDRISQGMDAVSGDHSTSTSAALVAVDLTTGAITTNSSYALTGGTISPEQDKLKYFVNAVTTFTGEDPAGSGQDEPERFSDFVLIHSSYLALLNTGNNEP